METLCTCMFVHNLVCTNVWLEVSMCIRLVYFGAHRGGSRWTGLTLHCDQNCVPMQMADARCLAVAATAAEAQRNQPARPTHTQTYCIPSCAFSSWACCPPPLAVLSLRKTSSRKFRSTATIRERGNVVDIWDNNTEGEARLGKHVSGSTFAIHVSPIHVCFTHRLPRQRFTSFTALQFLCVRRHKEMIHGKIREAMWFRDDRRPGGNRRPVATRSSVGFFFLKRFFSRAKKEDTEYKIQYAYCTVLLLYSAQQI